MANTIVLGCNWYMQPQGYKEVREIINYFFMFVFTAEATLKIIAQRCDYFKDGWNLFDFAVVLSTLVILCLSFAGIGENLSILGTILLTLRTLRVFRLIKRHKKLNEIYETLKSAAPAMASLFLLLMLFIFMFSIIGIQLFALVDIESADVMDRHVNF